MRVRNTLQFEVILLDHPGGRNRSGFLDVVVPVLLVLFQVTLHVPEVPKNLPVLGEQRVSPSRGKLPGSEVDQLVLNHDVWIIRSHKTSLSAERAFATTKYTMIALRSSGVL
jgi:hypothetical protein